jgi:hypothetical protein
MVLLRPYFLSKIRSVIVGELVRHPPIFPTLQCGYAILLLGNFQDLAKFSPWIVRLIISAGTAACPPPVDMGSPKALTHFTVVDGNCADNKTF